MRYSQSRPTDLRFRELNAQDLLRIAASHRAGAATVKAALLAQDFTNDVDVFMAARALVHAGFCYQVHKPSDV